MRAVAGPSPAAAQVAGPLAVVEAEDAWLVARAEDPADWLVAFEKSGGAGARIWAEAMARTYNRRLVGGPAGPTAWGPSGPPRGSVPPP